MIWVLLLAYQAKHFFADFPLQANQFMLGKFKPGWDFLPPLIAHCAVHAAMTLGIVMFVKPELWWLALVDFVAHFTMDRLKAGPKWFGRWKPLSTKEYMHLHEKLGHHHDDAKKPLRDNKLFWITVGIDQAVHHLTHYFIIWMLVTA